MAHGMIEYGDPLIFCMNSNLVPLKTIKEYMGTVWDDFDSKRIGDFLMLCAAYTKPSGSGGMIQTELKFIRLKETNPIWRKIYRYVGNPLAAEN